MSIISPKAGWFKAPAGTERMWIGVALIWCLILFAAMPYWHFKGKQNSTGESYSVEPAAFVERVNQYVKTNQVGEQDGIPIVEGVPGGDVYLPGSRAPCFRERTGACRLVSGYVDSRNRTSSRCRNDV